MQQKKSFFIFKKIGYNLSEIYVTSFIKSPKTCFKTDKAQTEMLIALKHNSKL